jgi:Secretion system C-terminal sorting domain
MKKMYFLVLALLVYNVNAQTNFSAISGCKTTKGIEITYDWAKNCPAAGGSLKGLAKIGFHSGAGDTWSNGVDWDNAKAVNGLPAVAGATNNKFVVKIPDLVAYYGLAAFPKTVFFVFNQGPTNTATPWGSEGKAYDNTNACKDFELTYATLAACATASQDLRNDVKSYVSPNPMTNESTLFFSNPDNKSYDLNIYNITGQLLRSTKNITESTVTIAKGDFSKGIYFVKLSNTEGDFLTEKLIVE